VSEINKSVKKQLPVAVVQKVEAMEPVNQQAFMDEFKRKRKSANVAHFLWFIGCLSGLHYLYVKKALWFVLFLFTAGGFGIWWIIDFFRVPRMVKDYNRTIALKVLRDIQVLN
jgi:TM2 domain-containing membrane protein YozV